MDMDPIPMTPCCSRHPRRSAPAYMPGCPANSLCSGRAAVPGLNTCVHHHARMARIVPGRAPRVNDTANTAACMRSASVDRMRARACDGLRRRRHTVPGPPVPGSTCRTSVRVHTVGCSAGNARGLGAYLLIYHPHARAHGRPAYAGHAPSQR